MLADDLTTLTDTLDAVRRQVYEPARVVLVGGDPAARRLAESEGLEWLPTPVALVGAAESSIDYLWFLRAGTAARPDALGALVAESERVGAGVAGSKILDGADPDLLVGVGLATDVFEEPFSGLDSEERDQGQHEVLRDVAAVMGASMLIRRDLARGIGGPDRLMAPTAAAVDLCQRARLRGARVVVVPSSEVLYQASPSRGRRWREQASRTRAMIKVYGFVTLLWSLPLLFLIGFVQAVLAIFVGRWMLFDWIRSWTWNLLRLPSTVSGRREARRNRVVGDAELFRYQVRGSVALRAIGAEIARRVRARLPGDDRYSLEAFAIDIRQPAVVTGVRLALFVLLATRSIWTAGLPAVGYSLGFSANGWDVAAAYAGGWNPAGLGSVEPLRPLLGVVGVVQAILLDNSRLAEYAFVAGAYAAGIWGSMRLLRTWGVQAVAGAVAGLVYVAGPAAHGIASNTGLGTLFALGALPWALRAALARWPRTWIGRIGRLAAVAALIALTAALAPLLLVVPGAALLVWALINVRDGSAWRAALVATSMTGIAAVLLVPWITTADLGAFLTAGEAFWTANVVLVLALMIAAVTSLIAAPSRLALVAGWGAVLAASGVLAARTARFDAGLEVENAGLALAAMGSAAIVGATLESIVRVDVVTGCRRVVAGVGVAAAVLVAISSLVVLVGGRAGLPGDQFDDAFGFTTARPGDPSASRILALGDPSALPGDSRLIDGAGYRVVSAPVPVLPEAWLHGPRLGDEALRTELEAVIGGETLRAGERLAPFGIRWVVILGDVDGSDVDPIALAWRQVFEGQLDLVPLGGGLRYPTFANEAMPAVRAVGDGGEIWTTASWGYEGASRADGRVVLAENANGRWGPGPWQQAEWGNEVSAADGEAVFDAVARSRNLARAAGVGFLVLVFVGWGGRRWG